MISQRRFSDYHLFRQLKESPLGSTYRAGRAQARAIDRVVLLHLFDHDPTASVELWERVHDRGPIQELLDGPLFARGVELGIAEGTPFVAYDYQVGRPLDEILARARERRMPLSIDQALAIVDEVATALVEAQKLRFEGSPILHGALTPELIRVSHQGKITTLGFDTAPALRALDSGSAYRSPEVRAGAPAAAADDVFSLAAILFEAVTGRAPAKDLSFAAQVDQALPFGEVSPLAPDLQDLLKHGLARRDLRTPDVVRWRHELRTVIGGETGRASAFQLSFFLHALFREELESESQQLQEEKAARWSLTAVTVPDEVTPETETVAEEVTSEAETLPTNVAPEPEVLEVPDEPAPSAGERQYEEIAEGDTDKDAAGQAPALQAPPDDEPETGGSSHFLVGLAASLLVATLAATAFFWFGLPTTGSGATASQPAAVTGPSDTDSTRQLVASQAASMENDLRAEFEPRLALLREQLVTAHRRTSTRPTPPPSQAPSADLESEDRDPSSLDPAPAMALDASEKELSSTVERATPENAPNALVKDAPRLVEGSPTPAFPVPDAEPLNVELEPAPSSMAFLDSVGEESVTEVPLSPSASSSTGDARGTEPLVSTPPRLTQEPRPRYPRVARRLGRSATVRLRVLVDETGKPVETELLSEPIGLGFEREARRAVMASRWTAASRDGVEVADWVVLKVEFSP